MFSRFVAQYSETVCAVRRRKNQHLTPSKALHYAVSTDLDGDGLKPSLPLGWAYPYR